MNEKRVVLRGLGVLLGPTSPVRGQNVFYIAFKVMYVVLKAVWEKFADGDFERNRKRRCCIETGPTQARFKTVQCGFANLDILGRVLHD